MTTIYIDVLLAVNLFVNYYLLLASARLVGLHYKWHRILLGASLGSLQALIILVDSIHPFILFLIRLVGFFCILLTTFGYRSLAVFIKTILIFLMVNFIFAGIVTAVWYLITPTNMLYKNGVVYFDISPLFLFTVTVLAYGMLRLIEYIFSKRALTQLIYTLKVEMHGNSINLQALYDTGNQMTDVISGVPVTVCEFDAISAILSYEDQLNISSYYCKGELLNTDSTIRLVPYHAVEATGLMLCMLPERVCICQDGRYKEIHTLIGIVPKQLSQGEYRAILPAKCINQ